MDSILFWMASRSTQIVLAIRTTKRSRMVRHSVHGRWQSST
jgi:hypothetical protein